MMIIKLVSESCTGKAVNMNVRLTDECLNLDLMPSAEMINSASHKEVITVA